MATKKQALGGHKDKRNAEAAAKVYQYERAFRGACSETFQEQVEHQRLYLSYRQDHRKAWEKKWRAFTLQPYPWVIIEGKVAAMTDVLNAGDPLVQAEGVNDEDVVPARKAEKLLDADLRANRWRIKAENLVREAAILGTTAVKVTWKHSQTPVCEKNPEVEFAFDEFRKIHADATGEEVPDNEEEYEDWKVEQSQRFGVNPDELPKHPGTSQRMVTTFRGPSLDRISLFDLRFDPLIPEWDDQRMIIQRIIKPKQWVLAHAGDDPRLPFDKETVEFAIEATRNERFNEWQQEQAFMLGLGNAVNYWPMTQDLCEIWECFDFEDKEHPYKVVLNRVAVINKDTRGMPYGHGQCPISLIRNVPQANMCMGISDLKAPKGLFKELWSLRDLRLDSVNLSAMGVYTKIAEMGISDAAKVLRPGHMIPVGRQDAIKKLDLGSVHPDVWREIPELKQEIDDATSVPTNLRGQPATVGRVSASEAGQRHSSALSRIKAAATRFEEEMYRPLKQMLYLRYKNTDPDEIVKIAGGGGEYAQVNQGELGRAIELDFHLRGPSKSLNKEMQTQQLMQFFQTYGPILPPHKQLLLARETYEVMGLKGADRIISEAEIAEAQAQAEAPQPQPGAEGQPAPQEGAVPPGAEQAPPQ